MQIAQYINMHYLTIHIGLLWPRKLFISCFECNPVTVCRIVHYVLNDKMIYKTNLSSFNDLCIGAGGSGLSHRHALGCILKTNNFVLQ